MKLSLFFDKFFIYSYMARYLCVNDEKHACKHFRLPYALHAKKKRELTIQPVPQYNKILWTLLILH